MRLDPGTVMILIIVGSSLMGTGLLAATRGHLGQIRGGSRWAEATLLQALGWTLVGPLRGTVPDIVWVVAGHGLLALSLALYLRVLADFSDKAFHPAWVYGTVVLQSVVLTALVLTGRSAGARTVVVAACSGALMLQGGHLLISSREGRLPSHMFTGGMFASCGFMMLARSLYELSGVGETGRGSNPLETAANTITYFVFYITATLLTFGFVLMLGDRYMTRQKQAEGSLKDALLEKEGLLQEVHHRVKNNLQLISSLMRIEAGRHKEPGTQAVLREMQSRIHSVVLLNEALYRTGTYSRVDLANYLRQIASHVFSAQSARANEVRLVLDLEPVEVITRQAIPCGLIVNELVTNSLKYAFGDGGSGEVRVGLQRNPDSSVRICVSDTGPGLPDDFTARRGRSLGLQLVSDLAKQLRGALEIGPKATFTVTFIPLLDEGVLSRLADNGARLEVT